MEEIIPRWEWRTFGGDFGEAERRILEHGPAKVRTSSETYVVSAAGSSNTKVRDGLMDIKRLQQVNAEALEQWVPVMKAGFPLTQMVLLDVFRAWNVARPRLTRDAYGFDEFIAELVEPNPALAAVGVNKERHGFTVNGCIVEIANLMFDGTPVRTVAVETEEPTTVVETVRALGLDRFENVNYVKALKRFKGIANA
jgi:exopolyphosphatase/guanosine-5'-triphosphate,3'-diphosphate pyrophosphatase